MILYGFERMLVEGLRTDSLYLVKPIRVSQLLSAILMIVGIALLFDIKRRQKNIAGDIANSESGEEVSSGLASVVEKMRLEENEKLEEITESEETAKDEDQQ